MKTIFWKIEAYVKENLEFHEIREYYVDICLSKKDYDLAIELLVAGKEKEKDRRWIVKEYSLKLKNLYKKTGQDELYEQELWDLILDHKAGNVEIYKELKSIYTDEEWVEKREAIFAKLTRSDRVDRLYLVDGLYDRLIELIINSPGLDLLSQYENILKDLYPQELLHKYENTVNSLVVKSSKRGHYRELVSILRRMLKYPGGREKVSEIVEEWKIKYKRRPAMLDELSRL
ncbi:MAG: hypothetical protein GX138_07140 [Firmicutes bacterium]|nr:hypothetical protein [Bacillota bacterium]